MCKKLLLFLRSPFAVSSHIPISLFHIPFLYFPFHFQHFTCHSTRHLPCDYSPFWPRRCRLWSATAEPRTDSRGERQQRLQLHNSNNNNKNSPATMANGTKQQNTQRMCLPKKERERETEGCVISASNLCAYLMAASSSAPLCPLPLLLLLPTGPVTATVACHALRRSSIALIAPIAML